MTVPRRPRPIVPLAAHGCAVRRRRPAAGAWFIALAALAIAAGALLGLAIR